MKNSICLRDKMKTYENLTCTYLMRRTPCIIRLDGKAFHTFTKGFAKPFDNIMVKTMQDTMKYLCENIEGCVLGYTQSDEITLILCDYQKTTSQAWFDYNVQKMCSVSSSMATMIFNKYFETNTAKWDLETFKELSKLEGKTEYAEKYLESIQAYIALSNNYNKAVEKGAMFDSRVFNVPMKEVNNCLIYRQQNAINNAIQAIAQANFTQKEIGAKSLTALQDMLRIEKGILFNEYPTHLQRGSCCIRKTVAIETEHGIVKRNKWFVDEEIPIFSHDTNYVNILVTF